MDDTTKPTFVSATYSTGNGLLAITFSEPIGGTATSCTSGPAVLGTPH